MYHLSESHKNTTVPIVMVLIGTIVCAVAGFLVAGAEGAAAMLVHVGILLIIGVPLGVVACFVASGVLEISFGPFKHALLKLAAIFLFPASLALVIPYIGGAVAFVLYFLLLAWFFNLSMRDAFICALIIWIVRLVVNTLILVVLFGSG